MIIAGEYHGTTVIGSTDPKPENPRKFARWLKPFNLTPTDVWDRDKGEQTSKSPIRQLCQVFVVDGFVNENREKMRNMGKKPLVDLGHLELIR